MNPDILMQLLHSECSQSHLQRATVIYLHTKSIAHAWPDVGAADAWRRYMMMLLISDEGLNACNAGFASGADVCGAEWEHSPWPHFSGIFFDSLVPDT